MERGNLTSFRPRPSLDVMKKHVSTLSIDAIALIAQKATSTAAVNAVAAGRRVTGWENGSLVEYGPGARPLPQTREEEVANVRIA